MFVYDVDGDLVNLHGKDVEVRDSTHPNYEQMVAVTCGYEIANNIDPFVLHYGTEEECRDFIKQLGHSLNVLKVKGIGSTKAEKLNIKALVNDSEDGRLQTDCECDYCRGNCT